MIAEIEYQVESEEVNFKFYNFNSKQNYLKAYL